MACLSPISLKGRGLVPCGKCVGCYSRRQADWACRLEHEYLNSANAYFVTLTYSEDNVPTDGLVNVLRRRDCQLWMKRLRKRIEPNRIRYFLCGEYGSKTLRPHYHAILFNYPSDSDVFTDCADTWFYGFVKVSLVKPVHFQYVAKYVSCTMELPEVLRSKAYRPFVLCSKKPGLGSQYLTDSMVDYHRNTLSTVYRKNGRLSALPRYYREKIFDDQMKQDIRDLNEPYFSEYNDKLMKLRSSGNSLDNLLDQTRKQIVERYSKSLKNRKL